MTRHEMDSYKGLSPSKRQIVAHKLLIELLSYQFAYPVRWIETQNSFLQREPAIQRYVEIGPTPVLANMAKKTVSKQYGSAQKSDVIRRQFLSSGDNTQELFYHYEETAINTTAVSDSESSTSQSIPSHLEPRMVTAAPATIHPSNQVTSNFNPAVEVADIPVAVLDIILSIVAQKLRKGFDQVPIGKSIQELSGGKSTLQNELIGDLGSELGNIPDGSEAMSITALSESLSSSFTGNPGKHMTALISKMISSKMPGGFNQQSMRQHLSSRWGIGPQRQTTVICFAVSLEPASRLPSVDAAKEFLDDVVKRYGHFSKIELNTTSTVSQPAPGTAVVDAGALDAARKEYKLTLNKFHEVLGSLLDSDEKESINNLLNELGESRKLSEEKLRQWTSEFGEEMFTGTTRSFDPRKIRLYDSWWNWAKVDFISLIQETRTNKNSPVSSDRIRMFLNRWTPALHDLMEFTLKSDEACPIRSQIQCSENFGHKIPKSAPVFIYTKEPKAPCTMTDSVGNIVYKEIPRLLEGRKVDFATLIRHGFLDRRTGERKPFINLQKRSGTEWTFNKSWTDLLMTSLASGVSSGLCFSGRIALVTGAGPGSIASEIIRGLLEGGAEVLVTTSRSPAVTAQFFNEIYKTHGSSGSKLVILPFNQGSKRDCEALIEHIYDNKDYGGDLDFIFPFAAIGETGELDNLEGKSELAHRLMLVNLLRLLGYIKKQKAARRFDTRPTNVILPLSPNHGIFGGDGLYSESKLGLETLFNRFHSESWSTYLSICGAVIGWTRGTGLMSGNNMFAEVVESQGTITFSPSEMAFSILALADSSITAICEDEPILADISGNMSAINGLKGLISSTRRSLLEHSKIQRALIEENERELTVLGHPKDDIANSFTPVRHRSTLRVGFPDLEDFRRTTAGLQNLQGMVDLKRTIVVVGFSEIGPCGSARTRWELEHKEEFSQNGYLEMAWIMGLVEHFNGEIKGKHYIGWVDTKSKEPVHDDEVAKKYGKYIKEHSGIRFVEPQLLDGYDPERKEFLHEVVVEEDLPHFEASKETADAMKLRHGNRVSITPMKGSEEFRVQIKKGAHFLVPKAVPFNRKVAGQLPSGWNPARYGIPEDIISQVDPTTLYVLCCMSQALFSAGIKDPYEIYKHIHVSELANCIGTGAGGLISMRGVYRDRYLERPVQKDILQESFLNAMDAWTNMLLLASAGPIKSPVGTCATAVESMDSGCDLLLLGKAKMAFVGGTDDFQEEMSYEFGNMKATASSDEEVLKGRLPSQMSRPSTTSRSGFVESAGCGVQIITTAEMAIEMGLPIYAIVAHTQMAGDQVGRSVPAPGQGVLTAAREVDGAVNSPLLNMGYRRQRLEEAVEEIYRWRATQLEKIKRMPDVPDNALESVETTASIKICDAQNMWGVDLRKQDPNISPMRAAMAVWGLTVDDIQVASLHGTSTKANDKNEADVINKQMIRLGRSKGNPLLAISQKYLTGHPKGAAGAWMFNGGLQVLQTGIIPGNRNADNIDSYLEQFENLIYPSKTVCMSRVKALMLTSFGFGQKGGIIVAIAPSYLFSAIGEQRFEDYRVRVKARQQSANLEFIRGIMTNSLFKAKVKSPWQKEDEANVFLDPLARVTNDPATGELIFDAKSPPATAAYSSLHHEREPRNETSSVR